MQMCQFENGLVSFSHVVVSHLIARLVIIKLTV